MSSDDAKTTTLCNVFLEDACHYVRAACSAVNQLPATSENEMLYQQLGLIEDQLRHKQKVLLRNNPIVATIEGGNVPQKTP